MAWTATKESLPFVQVEGEVTEPVEYAASELRRYLGRVLGAEPPGSREEGSPRIVVLKEPDDDLGEEGYELSAEGDTLRIRGGGDAGVVYGVYEFLRRCGGCRFSGLGPDGEHVPRRERISPRSGLSANFTSTTVPPVKSMPRLRTEPVRWSLRPMAVSPPSTRRAETI